MKIIAWIVAAAVLTVLVLITATAIFQNKPVHPHFKEFVFVTAADANDLVKLPVILHLKNGDKLIDPGTVLPYFSSTAIYRAWAFDTQRVFEVTAKGYDTQTLVVAGAGGRTVFLNGPSE